MKRILIFGFVIWLTTSQGLCGGFSSLKLGCHARSEAMGMAFTALADDGSAGFWNPAGLASLQRKDMLLSFHRWIEDVRDEFLAFGWGGPGEGMGIHVLYTDMGEFEQRIVPSPTPMATFSAHELIFGVSYARMVFNRFDVGMTIKLLYEKIYIEEAWGVGVDLGFLWHVWSDGLRIGGVLQNLGKTNALFEEDISLPMTVRLGLAYPLNTFGGQWIFVVDGIKEKGFPYHLHGGIEYGWRGRVFIRCGYQTGYEARDITGGIGVAWGQYRLDYSYMPLGAGLGDSHRFTVGIGW